MFIFFFFFKQKTAYEMRISDWSSDVCSSDLELDQGRRLVGVVDARLDRVRMPGEREQLLRDHFLDHAAPADVLVAGVSDVARGFSAGGEGGLEPDPAPFAELVVVGECAPAAGSRGGPTSVATPEGNECVTMLSSRFSPYHLKKNYYFFFKQKTAYEMRISDWSSDVCSSDLAYGCQVNENSRSGTISWTTLRQRMCS